MGEFRIQNDTVDHVLIRSSPQEISSGSNASTHFHVKTASIQNFLEFLISLITFRHFYNKGRKDVLKFSLPVLSSQQCLSGYRVHLLLQVEWKKKTELEFFSLQLIICFIPASKNIEDSLQDPPDLCKITRCTRGVRKLSVYNELSKFIRLNNSLNDFPQNVGSCPSCMVELFTNLSH